MGFKNGYEMVYGTRSARRHECCRDAARETEDVSRLAVKGMVTVATVGVTATLLGGVLGSLK
jgi:hypothetical protein